MYKILPNLLKISVLALSAQIVAPQTKALEYNDGQYGASVSGNLGLGGWYSDKDTDVIQNFNLRGAGDYALSDDNKIGMVYSIDSVAAKSEHPYRDAFLYFENSNFGRIELGLTDSVAAKLGVGLPDVGGLRINDYSMIYNRADINSPVIANLTTGSTRYAFRVSAVSSSNNPWQYGISIAPISDHFNYAADVGAKYRKSEGKTKIALSLGASFIENPNNLAYEIYLPPVNADWRAQFSSGFNLQYNSWIWGASARMIYDKNPIGPVSDGVATGGGVSYDLLNWSASVSYTFSDVGLFHDNGMTSDDTTNTGILSLRYKFNEFLQAWVSGGTIITNESHPFISAGLQANF